MERTTSVVDLVVRGVTEAEASIAAGGSVLAAISRLTTMIERNQSNYTHVTVTRYHVTDVSVAQLDYYIMLMRTMN